MADADDSYDLSAIDPFVDALRAGNDLVMGNRFQGGIDQGAMPTLHRYLRNPVLSFVARLFFCGKSGDFHCAMAAFLRAPTLALDRAGSLGFDVHTLVYAAAMIIVGYQAVAFALFTKIFAVHEGLLPEDPRLPVLFRYLTLEAGLVVGLGLIVVGLGTGLIAV